MTQPFARACFDAMGCYVEVRRVLNPRAIFLCYEWCLTDRYDLGCAEHVGIKTNIKEGDGLPGITLTNHCLVALREAGFEMLEERNLVNYKYGGWQVPSTGEYLTSKEVRKHPWEGKP